jgi:geranylgeranyl diphosphate synthase type II
MLSTKLVQDVTFDRIVSLDKLIEQVPLGQNRSIADDAIAYHMRLGGSRTRSNLTFSVAEKLGIDADDALILAAITESLHNASLIHDDLSDGDVSRRGGEAVWYKYGANMALCCGDLLISRAFGLLAKLNNPLRIMHCVTSINNAVSKTIFGQCLDINPLDWANISADQFSSTVANKSVPLISLCMDLPINYMGLKISEDKLDAVFYPFATAYQILDDVCDWQQDREQGRCNYLSILAKQNPYNSQKEIVTVALNQTTSLLNSCRQAQKELPNNLNDILNSYIKTLKNKVAYWLANYE